jgi:acyl-CoA dehydrogenase
VAHLMRLVVFPRGRTYFAPADRLGHEIVESLMMPSETRDRLAHGIYRTIEPGNPAGLLQEALVLAMRAEPLEKRLRVEGVKSGRITALDLPGQIEQAAAIGLLDAAEAQLLREFDRKVMEIVNVDDFASEELAAGVRPVTTEGRQRQIA